MILLVETACNSFKPSGSAAASEKEPMSKLGAFGGNSK